VRYPRIRKIKSRLKGLYSVFMTNSMAGLSREAFSASFPSPGKNFFTTDRRHARTKAVFVFSFTFAWLISAFHYCSKFSAGKYPPLPQKTKGNG